MELWIRSQNKLTLMKTTYVYVAREEVCAYDENKCWSTIGVYKSQERALEVLDEIQAILSPKLKTTVTKDGLNVEVIDKNYDVYQMPEN